MIEVVCAYIEINKNVLIARRATGDESVYGKWEFPGGKIEPGETKAQAIEREIKEEFEVVVHAEDELAETIHMYPNKDVKLTLIRCNYVEGEFTMQEDHLDYTWVHKEDLINYDLAAADLELVQKILN